MIAIERGGGFLSSLRQPINESTEITLKFFFKYLNLQTKYRIFNEWSDLNSEFCIVIVIVMNSKNLAYWELNEPGGEKYLPGQ